MYVYESKKLSTRCTLHPHKENEPRTILHEMEKIHWIIVESVQ